MLRSPKAISDAEISARMEAIARAVDNGQYADETEKDHTIIQAVLLGVLLGLVLIYAICI